MQSNEEKSRVEQLLLDMFSNASRADIVAICERNQWNTEKCIDCLINRDSKTNVQGAIPKSINNNKTPKMNEGYSMLEQKVIDNVKLGYRVLVVMRGAPGSGKSTLARNLLTECFSDLNGYSWQDFIFSSDDFFHDANGRYEYQIAKLSEAHEYNKRRVQEKVMSAWSPIFVDNTNMQIWEMIPYIRIALRNGYIVDILEPRTPWRRLPEKLASKNSHGVPRDKIQRMLNKYESATIGDILKTIRDIHCFNSGPQMRKYPPITAVKQEPIPTILWQPSTSQNMNSMNATTEENYYHEENNKTPKTQRNLFKKPYETQENHTTCISTDSPKEELETKPENKLLQLLKESVENISRNENAEKSEEEEKEKFVENSFERHTVDCPNENQVFALLRRIYENKSISGLWDLFVKCNGNIDWAIDILLKEDEFPQLSIDKSSTNICKMQDDYVCNCGNVESQSTLKNNDECSNNNPVKNFKILNNTVSNLHSQLEKQEIKNIFEKKFVFGDERSRLFLSSEKKLNFSTFQPNRELVDSSTQTDDFEENNENTKEMVEIVFDMNIFEQLYSIFQSETIDGEGLPLRKNMCTNVFLPKALAKDLYMLCMESVYNQMEEERQQAFNEDEHLAKFMQNLEYKSYPMEQQNTQELNDLKMAFELLGLDLKKGGRVENNERQPIDLATHLTLLKLADKFPETPPETVLDILQAHNNNYEETIKVLLANNVKSVLNEEKEAIPDQQVPVNHDPTSTKNVKRPAMSMEEAKRFALKKFEESRNLAVHHCQLKGECYQKAKEMVQKGNSAVAVYYSRIANLHKRKIDMYNQCAANSIIEVHKYSKNNPELLDLHYLHVAEAIGCLDLFLDSHISSLRNTTRIYRHVFIITGRGLHSSGGVSTIKNKVKNRLKERNLRWNEVNPGLLKVKLFSTSRYSK